MGGEVGSVWEEGEAYGRVGSRVGELFAYESVHPFGLLVRAAGVDAGDYERHF